ncbi:MAG TPA: site-specific integrase [bacterium]|nr:site-specific integrase [bacterium]
MSKPNVHGLPQHLRKDGKGYFLDYFVKEGGLRRRKRVRLGQIPLAQAKRILAEHTKEIVAGEFLPGDKPQVSFDEAAEAFLAFSMARKKSYKRDTHSVKALKAFFGGRPLISLTPSLVEDYLTERQKKAEAKGKTLKGATLNREIACLKTIARRAVLDRKIEWNPVVGVRMFRETSRNRTLTPEEYRRLLENCSPHYRPVVQVAYVTGMRRGEITGLKWEQVDLKEGVITLKSEDTKTQEAREIPLDEGLIDLFRKVPKVLGSPFVFNFRGHGLKDPKTAFLRACQRASISDFHFHDLRHCAVTNFRKAGVSDSTIMSISGHKTHAVFRRYDRIDRGDRKEALRRVRMLANDTGMTPEGLSKAQGFGG